MDEIIQRTIENLKKRNFNVSFVEDKLSASNLVMSMINSGESVGWGGSVTLIDSGILDSLNERKELILLDRTKGKTSEESEEIMRECLHSDVFLTSANAILSDGRIINIDGRGNRIAATIYGPKKKIFVIGKNKIVDGNLEDGISRIKNIASPKNAQRLDKNTPCKTTGKCMDCSSPDRICRSIGVIDWEKKDNPNHIIIINEELGY